MDKEQIKTVLEYIGEHYPDRKIEAEKCAFSLDKWGDSHEITRKRLDVLFSNLRLDVTDQEREMIATAFFASPQAGNRDKRIVVRVTDAELLDLHERAAMEHMTLSDWVRGRLGMSDSNEEG